MFLVISHYPDFLITSCNCAFGNYVQLFSLLYYMIYEKESLFFKGSQIEIRGRNLNFGQEPNRDSIEAIESCLMVANSKSSKLLRIFLEDLWNLWKHFVKMAGKFYKKFAKILSLTFGKTLRTIQVYVVCKSCGLAVLKNWQPCCFQI